MYLDGKAAAALARLGDALDRATGDALDRVTGDALAATGDALAGTGDVLTWAAG